MIIRNRGATSTTYGPVSYPEGDRKKRKRRERTGNWKEMGERKQVRGVGNEVKGWIRHSVEQHSLNPPPTHYVSGNSRHQMEQLMEESGPSEMEQARRVTDGGTGR